MAAAVLPAWLSAGVVISTTATPLPDGSIETIPGLQVGFSVSSSFAPASLSSYKVRWDFNGDGYWDNALNESSSADGFHTVGTSWSYTTFSAPPTGVPAQTRVTLTEVRPVAGGSGTFASQTVVVLNEANRAPIATMRPVSYQVGAPALVLDWRASHDPDGPYGDRLTRYSLDIGNNGSWDYANIAWGTTLQPGAMPAQTLLISAAELAGRGVNTAVPGVYQVALRVWDSYGTTDSARASTVLIADVLVEEAAGEDKLLPAWLYGGESHVNHDHADSQIWNSVFNGSDLGSASLRRSEATAAQFLNCNLQGADFTEALLAGARFDGSNLRGANFSGADLSNVTSLPLAAFDSSTLYDARTNFTGSGFDPLSAGWTLVPEPNALLMVAIISVPLIARRARQIPR